MTRTYLVDGPAQEISDLLSYDRWHSGAARRFKQLDYLTREALGSDCPTGPCEPVRAAQLLRAARESVEIEALKIAARYSPYRWLWYLRRLPRFVFAGNLKSTAAYDSALAECLSSRSAASSPFQVAYDGGSRYRIKNDVIEVLVDYCATIIYLSQIHTNLRWTGKGAPIRFQAGGLLIGNPEPTEEVENAVKIYDSRCDQSANVMSRTGTASAVTGGSIEHSVLAVQLIEAGVEELRMRDRQDSALVRFSPRLLSLESISALHRDKRVRSDWLEPSTLVLALLLRIMLRFHAESSRSFAGIQIHGYSVLRKEELFQTFDLHWIEACEVVGTAFPGSTLPADSPELFEAARNLGGRLWPLHPGPPIRTEGDVVCCDLYTATGQLLVNLEFPSDTGEMANARSEHFELAVQSVIDETGWRPDGELRKFVRREIRVGDTKITDLDALGQCGDTLLLVSCKSKIYSAQYDAGDFRTVRNYASAVEDAVVEWTEIVRRIRERPVGDNYDFRSFRDILGVVVLPNVFYAPLGVALTIVASGLYAASSISELERWLNGHGRGHSSV